MYFKGFLTFPTMGTYIKNYLFAYVDFSGKVYGLYQTITQITTNLPNNHIACFIEHLLGTEHCPKPLCINSCNPHNNPLS